MAGISNISDTDDCPRPSLRYSSNTTRGKRNMLDRKNDLLLGLCKQLVSNIVPPDSTFLRGICIPPGNAKIIKHPECFVFGILQLTLPVK